MPAQNAALAAKEKGNAAFKAGDFPAAIGHYTSAILADPKDPTYPLNRAAAYLKLGKNDDAERDCTLVLSLDSKNVKALFRRGQATSASGKHEQAVQDLQRALQIEPGNASVKEELKRIQVLMSAPKPTLRAHPAEVPVAPLPATSAPKRRRVPITIIEPSPPQGFSETSDVPKSADGSLLTPVSTRTIGQVTARPSTTTSMPMPPSNPPASFQQAKKVRDTTKAGAVGGGIFRTSGQHTIVGHQGDVHASTSTSTTAQRSPSETEKSQVSFLPKHSMSASTQAPMTSFMFIKSWDSLREPEKRWKLLTQIPPSSLPDLFQTFLEAHMLASIVRLLSSVLDATVDKPEAVQVRPWVEAYMINLPRVPRFSTMLLLLSKDEKSLAKKILASLQAAEDRVDGWAIL